MFKLISSRLSYLFFFIALVACTDGGPPQKGTHYELLPSQLGENLVSPVTEVFSLNCGHCRSIEKLLPTIESSLSENIGKLHVTFNENAQISALIYYAAVIQLRELPDHQMMEELFAAAQMGKRFSQDEIKRAVEKVFLSRNLISPYDFDEKLQQALYDKVRIARAVTQQAKIESVPTFIINGKYQIITSGHKDTEDITRTINYLLTL